MHYVLYEMTWAEYELRLFSYKRQKEREDRNFREVAFNAMWSFNVDPKSLPKTREKFWSIGSDEVKKDSLTDAQREAFLKATQKYKQEVNERKSKS